METGQDDRKVPQPPTRRGSWKGTGRRTIGQRAGHTIHLETEEVTGIKKNEDCIDVLKLEHKKRSAKARYCNRIHVT